MALDLSGIDLIWRHVIINLRYWWPPGDPRGFHNRDHRIHSSGDYKNPPPPGAHAGLYHYHTGRAKGARRRIALSLREVIAEAIRQKLQSLGCEVLCISVGALHVHFEATLPRDPKLARRAVGACKQRASHGVRAELPGPLWADGATLKPIKDRDHHKNTYLYIRDKQEPGTLVWDFRRGYFWMK